MVIGGMGIRLWYNRTFIGIKCEAFNGNVSEMGMLQAIAAPLYITPPGHDLLHIV